ncbi:MAG TPA: hypothetical protein VK573_12280 [Gemmatimonadales bacterium]|nr:hypothetical protein [Gemmatimonadales bacterium]
MTVLQLMKLIPPLWAIYDEYDALQHPTFADAIPYGIRTITTIAEAGVTLEDLAELLEALGPVLPLILRTAK